MKSMSADLDSKIQHYATKKLANRFCFRIFVQLYMLVRSSTDNYVFVINIYTC